MKKKIALFCIIFLGLMTVSCSYVGETIRPILRGMPDEHDPSRNHFRIVQNDTLHAGFSFVDATNENLEVANIVVDEKSLDPYGLPLYEFVKYNNTLSFVVIRNDTILYKYFAPKFSPQDYVTSYSIAKTFVAMLIGIAIEEGKINSVNDIITDYIPELNKDKGFNLITIKHLLQHTSGIKFSKKLLSPWSDQSNFYYTKKVRKRLLDIEIHNSPQEGFNYSSINTMLLTIILENVTGMSISKYLEEKIWSQIEMDAPATWNIDSNDSSAIEKSFCGLNAQTMDFAKFGRLLLNKGNWNGKQIIPESFILEAITPSLKDGGKISYGYLGVGPTKYGSYFSPGLYGQLIYMYPERNIIIVRFSKSSYVYHPEFWAAMALQIIDQL